MILPRRLAEHADPGTRAFYSLQCEVQCQLDFAAGGAPSEDSSAPAQPAWWFPLPKLTGVARALGDAGLQ
eukprot:SAG11_NODE_10450_length_831_cov_0.913934_2_plen_69_part_01